MPVHACGRVSMHIMWPLALGHLEEIFGDLISPSPSKGSSKLLLEIQ